MTDPQFRRRIAPGQPQRDIDETQGKFKAYYRVEGNPTVDVSSFFGGLGFEVIKHVGFIGHFYYDRFPLLKAAERALRPALISARVPVTLLVFLVLRKR